MMEAMAAAPVIPAFGSIASRTSGTGPLCVFFDATATTGNVTYPFHDLLYRWSFGDATSGKFSYGANTARNKSMAFGPMAAHCFDPSASVASTVYTVNLIVSDGTLTSTRSGTITVAGGNTTWATTDTVCASNGSDFTGCPAGATQVSSSSNLTSLCTTYATASRRILLQRGGSWTAATSCLLKTEGTVGMIGAYGTGAKPIITGPAGSRAFAFSSSTTPAFTDWRLVDLAITGGTTTEGIYMLGGATRLTLLRLDFSSIHVGIDFSDGIMEILNTAVHQSVPYWDQVAVVDCTFDNISGGSGGYGLYMSATKFMFLGNYVGDTTAAEHGLRIQYTNKAVISSNTFGPSATAKLALTIRGQDFLGTNSLPAGTYTESIIVSDSKFIGKADFTVSNGTATFAEEQLQRYELWERNYFTAAAGTQAHITFSGASQVTLRNNVFDSSGALAHTGIALDFNDSPSLQVPCDLVWIYNNTFYSGDTDSDFRAIWLSQALKATNITIKNNLAYAPNDSVHIMIYDGLAGPTTPTTATNSTDTQVQTTDPFGSFGARIGASSYAATGGTDLYPASHDDYYNCDYTTANIPIGALIPRTRAKCKGIGQ